MNNIAVLKITKYQSGTKLKLIYGMAGFTLIELLVTVSIIAILAAIAVPSYRNQVVTNSEEQARASALSIANQLASHRSKTLSYLGFVPINDGCTAPATNCYSVPASGEVYVPLGSTLAESKYTITVVDGTSFLPLTNAGSAGRSWRIVATPNGSKPLLDTADAFYLDSQGNRVTYDFTVRNTLDITSANVAVSGTGIEAW